MGAIFSLSTHFFEQDNIWIEYNPSNGFIIGENDKVVYIKYKNEQFQFNNSYSVNVLENKRENTEVHVIHKNDIIYACSIWKKNKCIDLRTINLSNSHKHIQN